MITEDTKLSDGDLAAEVNALLAGIPDPASLVAGADRRENGTPTIQH